MHPVYYCRKASAEKKYTSYELEVLAIVKALKRFQVYLLGIPFKIITDCCAFMATMNKKDLSVYVVQWALLLEEFNYIIEHRPDKSICDICRCIQSLFIITMYIYILSCLKSIYHPYITLIF